MATGPSTNPDSEWEGPKRSVIPSKSQMTASPESPKHFDFGSLSLSSKETEEKELDPPSLGGGVHIPCAGAWRAHDSRGRMVGGDSSRYVALSAGVQRPPPRVATPRYSG